jgi:type II secretory pathway component PulM
MAERSGVLAQVAAPLRPLAQALLAAWAPVAERSRTYLKPIVDRARTVYERLEPREKRLVKIAGSVLSVFLGYNLIYLPVQNLRADLGEKIVQREHETVQVARLIHDYQQLKLDLASAEKRTVRDKDFDLFSVVDTAITGAVGADKIGGIDRTDDQHIGKNLIQHRVTVNLKALSLEQMVNTLYGLKMLSQPVLVSNFHIKKNEQPNVAASFDVDMTLVATARNG